MSVEFDSILAISWHYLSVGGYLGSTGSAHLSKKMCMGSILRQCHLISSNLSA